MACRIVTALTLVVLMGAQASSAHAHHPSDDHPTGTLVVPAATSSWIQVEGTRPGDRLQWTWVATSGTTESLAVDLMVTDSFGRERTVLSSPAGQTFGTLVAPEGFTEARLVWRNGGDTDAEVSWAYGASAPFWRRPAMFLPALIPVFLIVACYAVGTIIDRARRRRHGQE